MKLGKFRKKPEQRGQDGREIGLKAADSSLGTRIGNDIVTRTGREGRGSQTFAHARFQAQKDRHRRGLSRGQVMVLSAIAMVALMGMVAVATDIGLLWSERRQMQTATDAAAIAAATALRNDTNVTSAADNVASLNGFTNGAKSATITVNNPPAGGLYAGNSNYIEVIITQPEPTYFLRVLGYNSIPVSTRAVSGAITGPACIYALDP